MQKIYKSIAALSLAMLCAPAFAESDKSTTIISAGMGELMITAVSDNGAYLLGLENLCYGTIWDLKQDKIIPLFDPNAPAECAGWDISDNGIVVGEYMGMPSTFTINGDQTDLEVPDLASYGSATSITKDGSIIVGWASSGSSVPCMWKNGELTVMDYPLVDDFGQTPQWVKASFVSADGNLVAGVARTCTGWYNLGIIWEAPEYKATYPFIDSMIVNGGNWGHYNITAISANGEWVAGGVTTNYDIDEEGYGYPRVYRYNTKSKEVTIIKDVETFYGIGDGGPSVVDDNGTLYVLGETYMDTANPWSRLGYVCQVGKPTVTLTEYLASEFDDTSVNETLDFAGISAATPDGKLIAGHGSYIDEKENLEYLGWVSFKNSVNSIDKAVAEKSDLYNDANNVYGVHGSVEVYNAAGQKVVSVADAQGSVSISSLENGVYVVKCNGKSVKIKK